MHNSNARLQQMRFLGRTLYQLSVSSVLGTLRPGTGRRLSFSVSLVLCCFLPTLCACNRGFYRQSADQDTYSILHEKGRATTWRLLPSFSIEPDRRSRFYDPTPSTDPLLPIPAPRIHGYSLPPLASAPAKKLNLKADKNDSIDAKAQSEQAQKQFESEATKRLEPSDKNSPEGVPSLPAPGDGVLFRELSVRSSHVIPASVVVAAPEYQANLGAAQEASLPSPPPNDATSDESELRIAPIPPDAWDSLPPSCLRRMLEFASVREEYFRSYRREVTESQLDPAVRLTLENIIELALINSREFQTRKETLYRVALRLTLQRFAYQLKFFSRGNGSALNYAHNQSNGITVNSLGIPTGLGIEKSLYTAGDFAARFANDVVLTFNGPTGFDSAVSSQLLFDLSQPLIQRDIRFETLTQAERDVVYAARDFVRFRKTLFRDLSAQYYNLLLSYRSIAINAQDYFSNLRGFNRAEAEFLAGKVPRFQVDQFEQNALRSSSNIVSSCNNLEGALDQIKIRIGIPTETPINIDLSELESLTLRDEVTVARELIRRSQRYLISQRQVENASSGALMSPTAELARRMLALREKSSQLDVFQEEVQQEIKELTRIIAQLLAEEMSYEAAQSRIELEKTTAQENPNQNLVTFRRIELIEKMIRAIELRVEQMRRTEQTDPAEANRLNAIVNDLNKNLEVLIAEMSAATKSNQFERRSELERNLEDLLQQVERTQLDVESILTSQKVAFARTEQDRAVLIDAVIQLSGTVLASESSGLTPVEIDMDEAMLTALVQRLDMMNRRALLADFWRQIKYAGDDLRSILNVRASESIRTRTGSDNPFDFTFDNSTTQLSLQFDAPLNRRTERNRFRTTLIDYNLALRNIIEAEDNIKLSVRNDIRQLALDQNQYQIAIASAALAFDRVISTREQLRTGYGNITARDFLEAQQAFTSSLNAVAQQHIGYVVDRIQLFLDLEQLQVDESGFWPELRNEKYPFLPNFDFPGTVPCPYDRLPNGPWYSHYLLRMTRVPSGQATSYRPPQLPTQSASKPADTPGTADSNASGN